MSPKMSQKAKMTQSAVEEIMRLISDTRFKFIKFVNSNSKESKIVFDFKVDFWRENSKTFCLLLSQF